jgi:hypothetical protein
MNAQNRPEHESKNKDMCPGFLVFFISDPIVQTESSGQGRIKQKEGAEYTQFGFDIGLFQPQEAAIGKFIGDDKIGGPEDSQQGQVEYAGDLMVPARFYFKVAKRETINTLNQQ